ncbi:hypothetical protein DFH07DRAFT_1058419 [Mycena maculata]|uniref:Uncharacterized protein n=1 Tax=Mycena maculata TaxID=230809 RepID=A0AAD7J9M0_9AGAR|nr:hypothetical protein DFH07DRAFT_1060183 [Mycena maculata]KAJ7767909.1 hypothetical protein DFH07DRAFT_1058419 [Mycena maculata]
MSTPAQPNSSPTPSWSPSSKPNISAVYGYPNAAELLPKAVLATSLQTAYVMVFFVALYYLISPKRIRSKADVPIYVYLFVTHCASWIFAMARIWGDAAQIDGALGLASDDAANLPGYIDCSSLFLILAAADLLLLYRVYVVWKQHAWYLIPLPVWMLANWGLYVVDIQRALDLGEKYTEASLISSVVFDVIATCLIAGRLMFHRSKVEILGASHQRVYGRLAVIFVESSTITSTCRLVWMAAFASGDQDVVSWVESVALFGPLLVIFRMVNSHASRKGTVSSTGIASSTMESGSYRPGHSLGSTPANAFFVTPKSIQPRASFSPTRSEYSDTGSQIAPTNYEKV